MQQELLKPSIEVQQMMDWAQSEGIQWPKLHYPVRFEPGYLGSVATEDIGPGEKIVWAPNQALFTSKLAYESELRPVFDQFPELFGKPVLAMATFIIWEKFKGDRSRWCVFLNGQPRENSVLQDWSEEELRELQDLRVVCDSVVRKQYHVIGYNYWKACLESTGKFSEEMVRIEEYTWAFRLVSTRSFGKFMPHITMIPVAEFLNHNNVSTYYSYQLPSSPSNVHLRYSGTQTDQDHDDDLISPDPPDFLSYSSLINFTKHYFKNSHIESQFSVFESWARSKDESALELKLQKQNVRPQNMDLQESDEKIACICAGDDEKYSKGEQVFMSYGRYSNRQLLISYGFVLKENKFNYASFVFDVSEFVRNLGQGKGFVKDKGRWLVKVKEGRVAEEFLDVLRVLLWKPEYGIQAGVGARCLELEVRVAGHAKARIVEELAGFETSCEEDLRIIEGNVSVRKYFAVLYRLQVKQILLSQVKLLDSILLYLRGSTSSLSPSHSQYFSSITK